MVRRLCKLLSCVFLFFVFVSPLYAEGTEAEKYIILEVDGKGKSRSDAVNAAWMEAVRQAVGSVVDAKTELSNEQVTERIITYSRGIVEKYEVVSVDDSKAKEGLYQVKLRAWVVRDVLNDGFDYVSKDGKEISFSFDDVKEREKLDAGKIEEQNATAAIAKNQEDNAVQLLEALLERYQPSDFLTSRITAKVTAVKDMPDTYEVPIELTFNDDLYYKSFLPELKRILEQIASKKKDDFLNKVRNDLQILSKKPLLPSDRSIIHRGADFGKNFSVAVLNDLTKASYSLYSFPKDVSDKITNPVSGPLASFLDRSRCIRGFRLVMIDDKGEPVNILTHGLEMNFLLSESLFKNGQLAFHPTFMNYVFNYGEMPLYTERRSMSIPFRFQLPQELISQVKSIRVDFWIEDDFKELSNKTRQAYRLDIANGDKTAIYTLFKEAADNGYPLAYMGLAGSLAIKDRFAEDTEETAGANDRVRREIQALYEEAWKNGLNEGCAEYAQWAYLNKMLTLEEAIELLAQYSDANLANALYVSGVLLERGEFQDQKRCVSYLERAAKVGHPDAMIRMGEIYDQGFYDVKPDKQRAAAYWKEGRRVLAMLADDGLPAAANELGRLYLEGLGSAHDPINAEKYYSFAKSRGYEDGEFYFWENYGVACRQVLMPENLKKAVKDKNWEEYRIYKTIEEPVARAWNLNPITCFYIVKSPIETKCRYPMILTCINLGEIALLKDSTKSVFQHIKNRGWIGRGVCFEAFCADDYQKNNHYWSRFCF